MACEREGKGTSEGVWRNFFWRTIEWSEGQLPGLRTAQRSGTHRRPPHLHPAPCIPELGPALFSLVCATCNPPIVRSSNSCLVLCSCYLVKPLDRCPCSSA